MTGFLARIYAFKLFDSLILIFPLYAVMFVDAGLTPFQIALILTAWSATTFVLQAPAGAVADVAKWGYGAALAGSLSSIALAIVAALSFPPAERAVRSGEAGYLAHLRDGLVLAVSQPAVLSILAFAAFTNALGGALEEFWP